MSAEENIRAQFAALFEQGSLARSACSGGFLKALRPLLDSGVVVEERSGAGRRLVVRDRDAVCDFFAQRYPDAGFLAGDSNRVASVARFRDTKAIRGNEPEFVCLRAWRDDALFRHDQPVNAVAATTEHGLFAFVLDDRSPYSLRGTCALVENPAVFTRLEKLKLPIALAVYGRGRVSNRFLEWLSGMTAPDFTLLHLPDYDPVGLSEFARMRERLGTRVHLHLPPELPSLFKRYSNRSLLDKPNSRELLFNLRRSEVPEVRHVLELMERNQAGLEQEALLLERTQS
ncbi:MAG: hypothetical protein HY735_04760 [Verrucomicrobia bacterium]|nr:hypothetical protein [Verrucomicrobiota bacterium]